MRAETSRMLITLLFAQNSGMFAPLEWADN
jgi:hypothetical protein